MCPISDYPFESLFQHVSGYSLHYIDVGDSNGRPVLFLHGVPTWSFTFRKIIPLVAEAGYRVIAPDLPGFGLSRNKLPPEAFSLSWLTQLIAGFMDECRISKPVLVAHDWGGVIGLMLASSQTNLFSGLILCNSLLPLPGMKAPFLFKLWRSFARFSPVLPVGMIVNVACERSLTRKERRGYTYPFRMGQNKRAIRKMPRLIPFREGQQGYADVVKAWDGLSNYQKAVLTLFSDRDPITRGGERIIQERIPGARNQAHKVLKGGHFIQEDAPEEIANSILAFMRAQA